MKRFFAFTLAETLIVMGIIGIVSALTLPNLNSSTGEKEKVAKVKKIYQNLNDAYGRATAIYGQFDEWFKTDNTYALQATRFGERMTEFMKVSKTCGLDINKGCFSAGPLLEYDGSVFDEGVYNNDKMTDYYKIITADGTSIAFTSYNTSYAIYVDIDGPNKGKNRIGEDRFTFDVDNSGVYPHCSNCTEKTGAFEYYDTYVWVIMNDNMDYLKCADKLNWQTKTSCK